MRFMACALLIVAAACGSDGPTQPTSASVAGTWSLQTINGTPLPYVVVQTGVDKVELTSDVITAVASGSFTQITQVRITQNGQVSTQSIPDAGSYSLSGTAVTFTFSSDGSTGTGSLSGNTLTVASDGFAYVYKKQ
jgi:hypothetical protein